MGRKKAVYKIKGGVITNTSITGPNLPESLYIYKNTGRIKNLYDTYDKSYKDTEKELDKIDILLDKATKEEQFNKELDLKKLKERLELDKFAYKKFSTYIHAGYILVRDLGRNFTYLVEFIVDKSGGIFKFFGFAGQGVFAKIIGGLLFIFIIVSIVLGFLNIIHNVDSDPTIINNNTISKSIVQSDSSEYIQPNLSLIQKISNSIYNLIPSQYTYKLNGISNSLTYITTGKNQFDPYLEPRDTITTGRWDDILHIAIKNDNIDKIYSTYKPKDIRLNFNDIYGSDYSKLPKILTDDIKYPTIYTIPINATSNGRFGLDLYNSSYNVTTDSSYKKLDKLFIPIDDIYNKTDVITTVKLNSINQSYNNMKCCYGTTLINMSYTGPILEFVDHNNINIRQKIYYDTKSKSYYYFKDNKIDSHVYTRSDLKETFTFGKNIFNNDKSDKIKSDNINVGAIFDQVGNNDLIFDSSVSSDARYPPELFIDYDTNILRCYFYDTKILYLKQPISFNNIYIEITIKADEDKWIRQGIEVENDDVYHKLRMQDLNLLASKTEPLVKLIKLGDTTKENTIKAYTLQRPGFIGSFDTYKTDKKETIKLKIEKNTLGYNLECLGNFHQPATYTNLVMGATGINWGEKGQWLLEQIVQRTFIGSFYNLIIYDIS